jgi:uncharacterized protein YjaG (DUF416 family)
MKQYSRYRKFALEDLFKADKILTILLLSIWGKMLKGNVNAHFESQYIKLTVHVTDDELLFHSVSHFAI